MTIDGGKGEVPNSVEHRKRFGKSNNQHPDLGQVRSLISGMYHIFNQFYLNIATSYISASETELAQNNLEHLQYIKINQPVLAIFDIGYPSIEFIDLRKTQKTNYLFRLSSNDYKLERENMQSADKNVVLRHAYQRLEKNKEAPRKKAIQVAEKLRAMKLAKAAKKVENGIEETLTYIDFPAQHWTRIRTNNAIERLNRKIKGRTKAIGAFPDGQSALMLVCARLRHVAATSWGSKRYMNMDHLFKPEEDQLSDIIAG